MADVSRDDYEAVRPSRFRLKSKKRRRRDEGREGDDAHKRRREHRHDDCDLSRHEAHPYRRPRSPAGLDDPSLYDDTYLPNARSSSYVDPDTAFRESLFDALADDEGAAYWEGVYGQPMHTYARPTAEREGGELEQMDDEEYAAYVRARMYERTHQHLFEERARREEARKRQREEEKIHEERERVRTEERKDREAWDRKVEDSIRRTERRSKSKRWEHAWETYLDGWEGLKDQRRRDVSGAEDDDVIRTLRRMIPWPSITGRWKDVTKEETEDFFKHAPGDGDRDLCTVLKMERVRWHPDKMQQRFGGTGLDAETMMTVTAVFQVVDRMWNEMKERR